MAEQLQGDFPQVASAISAGLKRDPSALVGALRDNRDIAAGFQSLCTTIEAYIVHILNTMSAEKGELLSQVQALETDIREKTGTLNALAKSVEQLSCQERRSANGGSTARRISKDPEPFSGGEKDVAKRQQQYVVWKSQINSCFAQDAAVFDTERRRILHIAGLLAGDAYELHRPYFDTITANPTDMATWHWKTAAEVFKTLSTQFETMDLAQQASQKFDNLFMLNKPFQNFVAELRALAQRCNKTEAQKVEALKKKVSRELADKLAYQPLPPPKEDFDAWCNLCQQLYNNEQEFKHFENLKSGRPTQQPQAQRHPPLVQNQPLTPLALPEAGEPMQLDSARAAAKAAARAFCGENNLCFYCRKPGHIVAECDEKRAADARFPNRNPNSYARARGYNMPRGRGGYRTPPYTEQRNPNGSRPTGHAEHRGLNATPFNQLRLLEQLEHGPGSDEAHSTASLPDTTGPDPPQGKD